MKKISIGILLSIMVMLASCSSDPVERLEKAVEKTNGVEQFKMSMAGDISVDTPEIDENSPLADLGNISIDMNSQVGLDKTKVDLNYSIMGLAVDMVMYGDATQSIVKMPMIDKYIVTEVDTENSMDVQQSKESMVELSNSINRDVIEKIKADGEITIEETELELPDGKIKVDKGTVKLKSEDVKDLLLTVTEKINTDENLSPFMEQTEIEPISEEERAEEIEELKKELEKVEIEDFEFAIYIDKDDYIVGQDIAMNIVSAENGGSKTSVDLELRMWDIGNEQNIEFPELTDENSINIKEYMNMMIPENFENGDFNLEEFLPEDFNPEDFDIENMEIPDMPEITIE